MGMHSNIYTGDLIVSMVTIVLKKTTLNTLLLMELTSGTIRNQLLTKMVLTICSCLPTLLIKLLPSMISSNKGPFFIYAAYQSVHTPLEAPESYTDDPVC